MSSNPTQKPVLVAGATGYIGSRLVPRLLEAGFRVRALARVPGKLSSRPWSRDEHLEIVRGDVLDPVTLNAALVGCGAVFYLVHSMNPTVADFSATDRQAAENLCTAAQQAGVERIIYLSGLGEQNDQLSHHLKSRSEVDRVLRNGSVPVTTLRAAMIIGSGSASFEILRYLVERLPVMITPRWVDTRCQPIGVRNVLHYLVGCLSVAETMGESFDIGLEEVVSYRQLMEIYAEEAGLKKRWIIPLPVLTPKLSSYWIHLVTPVPAALARPLAEGLANPVVCRETRIRALISQELFDTRTAIRMALGRIRQGQVESTWFDAGAVPPAEWSLPGDPSWAGGAVFEDARYILLDASQDEVWQSLVRIGGGTGWYAFDWLWRLRGWLDKMVGGVGLRRGRRDTVALAVGDVLDFWRVAACEEPHRLLLVAEMKLPGAAVLEFGLSEIDGHTEILQTARFLPRGLFGLLYWWLVASFHSLVFSAMLRGIGQASGGAILRGPEKAKRAL